jgi:hypothetical protein
MRVRRSVNMEEPVIAHDDPLQVHRDEFHD